VVLVTYSGEGEKKFPELDPVRVDIKGRIDSHIYWMEEGRDGPGQRMGALGLPIKSGLRVSRAHHFGGHLDDEAAGGEAFGL
jgi:hypothetical protein